MTSMFSSTFWTIFNAIFQLSLISMAAGVLVRKQVVSQEQVQAVSTLTVNVFLPCLIVSTRMNRFDPGQFPFGGCLPWGFYNRLYRVSVPVGVKNGGRLRLAGMGRAGLDGATGNLYLTVEIK